MDVNFIFFQKSIIVLKKINFFLIIEFGCCRGLLCNMLCAMRYAVILLHNCHFTAPTAAILSESCSVNWQCNAVPVRN